MPRSRKHTHSLISRLNPLWTPALDSTVAARGPDNRVSQSDEQVRHLSWGEDRRQLGVSAAGRKGERGGGGNKQAQQRGRTEPQPPENHQNSEACRGQSCQANSHRHAH